MKTLQNIKYHLLLAILLVLGLVLLTRLMNAQKQAFENEKRSELQKAHEEAVLRFETGVKLYSTLVSSIHSFIDNSEEFPSEEQLQAFIADIIYEIDFQDSIVVSWVDTNQIFRYVVTPSQIDPFSLKGTSVEAIRPNYEIEELNALMHQDETQLFDPINLQEGWVGFPFNFPVKDSLGRSLGYIAPLLNAKYLLEKTYSQKNMGLFAHKFTLDNGVDFSRDVVYDNTKILTQKRDPEFYKNFHINPDAFVSSQIQFYGLNITISTAYKQPPTYDDLLSWVVVAWYILLVVFVVVSLVQFSRNRRLRFQIQEAHGEIQAKNEQLTRNLVSIQTLIKEVHHRVKNNLQIMSSLMNLQKNTSESEEVKSALNASQIRIQSMAIVHQKLYANKNLSEVNLKEYLSEFLVHVQGSLDTKYTPEKLIEIDPSIMIDMDTIIPLGLILNELITNSYKHAFNGENDQLSIRIERNNGTLTIEYKDSGPGIPDHIDPATHDSLGLELIYLLTEQLGGNVYYTRSPEHCFCFQFDRK